MAVADSFDAMTSERPYSVQRTAEEALREIRDCAGTQFDPVVVEAFCAAWSEHQGVALCLQGRRASLVPPAACGLKGLHRDGRCPDRTGDLLLRTLSTARPPPMVMAGVPVRATGHPLLTELVAGPPRNKAIL